MAVKVQEVLIVNNFHLPTLMVYDLHGTHGTIFNLFPSNRISGKNLGNNLKCLQDQDQSTQEDLEPQKITKKGFNQQVIRI